VEAHVRLSGTAFAALFWGLTVALAIAVTWFMGNLLYSVFWSLAARWGLPITETEIVAYIGAHLVPFVVIIVVGTVFWFLIRNQLATATGIGRFSGPQTFIFLKPPEEKIDEITRAIRKLPHVQSVWLTEGGPTNGDFRIEFDRMPRLKVIQRMNEIMDQNPDKDRLVLFRRR
jgi:hypothetical protein